MGLVIVIIMLKYSLCILLLQFQLLILIVSDTELINQIHILFLTGP